MRLLVRRCQTACPASSAKERSSASGVSFYMESEYCFKWHHTRRKCHILGSNLRSAPHLDGLFSFKLSSCSGGIDEELWSLLPVFAVAPTGSGEF